MPSYFDFSMDENVVEKHRFGGEDDGLASKIVGNGKCRLTWVFSLHGMTLSTDGLVLARVCAPSLVEAKVFL